MYAEKFSLVELGFEVYYLSCYDHGSWLQIFNALIRRFLTDDVRREAHEEV